MTVNSSHRNLCNNHTTGYPLLMLLCNPPTKDFLTVGRGSYRGLVYISSSIIEKTNACVAHNLLWRVFSVLQTPAVGNVVVDRQNFPLEFTARSVHLVGGRVGVVPPPGSNLDLLWLFLLQLLRFTLKMLPCSVVLSGDRTASADLGLTVVKVFFFLTRLFLEEEEQLVS